MKSLKSSLLALCLLASCAYIPLTDTANGITIAPTAYDYNPNDIDWLFTRVLDELVRQHYMGEMLGTLLLESSNRMSLAYINGLPMCGNAIALGCYMWPFDIIRVGYSRLTRFRTRAEVYCTTAHEFLHFALMYSGFAIQSHEHSPLFYGLHDSVNEQVCSSIKERW